MKEIIIENIKNIKKMAFEIPLPGLYVITGKNGTGKTTLFTCINRICNNNSYRIGFQTSGNDTFDIFSGSITYKAVTEDNSVKYTRRASGEWRPHKKIRQFLKILDILK